MNMKTLKHISQPQIKMMKSSALHTITKQSNSENVANSKGKTDIKYILIWNMEKHWNMEKSYHWSIGRENFIKKGCKENRCKVIVER